MWKVFALQVGMCVACISNEREQQYTVFIQDFLYVRGRNRWKCRKRDYKVYSNFFFFFSLLPASEGDRHHFHRVSPPPTVQTVDVNDTPKLPFTCKWFVMATSLPQWSRSRQVFHSIETCSTKKFKQFLRYHSSTHLQLPCASFLDFTVCWLLSRLIKVLMNFVRSSSVEFRAFFLLYRSDVND